ncbi:MAG: hypothetical protein U0791_01820 [Gemmataceae bacterium]
MRDDLLQLLTAAIDGELSPAEQWTVHRLLCESEEARTLFARLQSDSARLKSLRKAPPANLVERVMASLPKAEPASQPVRRDRSRKWLVVGLAASVLLAIGSASLLHRPKDAANGSGWHQIAQNHEPAIANLLPREAAPLSMPPAPPVPSGRNVAELLPAPPAPPDRIDEIPPPRVKGADVFTFPPQKAIPPLERFVVRVPFLVSLADLERDDAKQNLLEELTREPAFRIDLFAKDTVKGVDAFQAAAKASGVTLLADAITLDRVKKKQANSVVVYAETLGAADIRDLLAKIAADDAKNPQRVFDSIHATPVLPADQSALKEVLGADPGLWKRPTADPKPISAGTGDELTKSLTAKPGDKPAVLLSFTPAAFRTNPALSKELKEFLAKRGERKASAVPFLLVIRMPQG